MWDKEARCHGKSYVGLTHPAAGESTEEEESLLRWGGLAGILSGILFIVGIPFFFLYAIPPATPEGLMSFPDIQALTTVGESLFMVTVFLTVILFLALYRALRGTSLALALFGSVLGVMGLVVHTTSALPVVAFAPIADLYNAPGATPADQATLLLLWQATQGMFNLLDEVGLLLITIAYVVLGVAMLRAPDFGKGFGGTSVVLGVLGVVSVSLFVADPLSLSVVGAIAIPIFVILPPLLGWKVYSLSRAG